MKNTKIFLCDNSIDGIFTAIYLAWESNYGHNYIKIMEQENFKNMELFTEYINVDPDGNTAIKVANSIREKISEDAYSLVCRSAMSSTAGRADAIYRFLILGFAMGRGVTDNLSHPFVHPLFMMDRYVNNETLHYLGFLRFSELKNTILFAKIRPNNNVITLIADHFSERLADENWLIYDEGRKTAVIHRKAYPWFYTDASDLDQSMIKDYTEEEKTIQAIWKKFVETIAIEDRVNRNLQYQMLPNRYREFMREVPYKEKNKG